LQDFDPADVGSGSTGDIRNERGLQQRRPPTEAASESAFAILTKLVQRRSRDLRLQPFKRQVRIKSTNVPQPAHCNAEIRRCSPRGVTRPRSKVCPSHFAQAEIAIVRSPMLSVRLEHPYSTSPKIEGPFVENADGKGQRRSKVGEDGFRLD